MASFSVSKQIHAPIERVFEVFSDLRRASERIHSIKRLEVLTDGPIRTGTRFRETRVMFGKDASEVMEITGFEPGRRYSVGCETCGSRFDFEYAFTSQGGGTLVTLSVQSRAITLFTKLFAPLSGMMMKQCQKVSDKDMEELKQFIESNR